MGLIMAQLQDDKPGLPYFDPDFTGEYPAEAPFTISELERIYPAASARSKEDEAFAARAHEETFRLQHGERGERALWQHILRVSVEDLKRNYDNLGVSFDVWLGESDAQKYIPQMLETVKAKGLCVESEGALVVLSYETGLGGSSYLVARCAGGADDEYPFISTDAGTTVDDIVECRCDRWMPLAECGRGKEDA